MINDQKKKHHFQDKWLLIILPLIWVFLKAAILAEKNRLTELSSRYDEWPSLWEMNISWKPIYTIIPHDLKLFIIVQHFSTPHLGRICLVQSLITSRKELIRKLLLRYQLLFQIMLGHQVQIGVYFFRSIIFFAEFAMTTPNNFLGRFNTVPYQLGFPQPNFHQLQQYPFNNTLRYQTVYPPLINFPYPFPQQAYFGVTHLPAFTPTFQGSFAQPAQIPPAPSQNAEAESSNNKIQKREKKRTEAKFIEISDDQNLPQQKEKSSEEKSTSSNNKIAPNISCINNKNNQQKLKQQKISTKIDHHTTRQKAQAKLQKTKQICKPVERKKKIKNQASTLSQIKKKAVFSQRIIQKNDSKKEPYRLTKKERQLLQICFLRETVNQIMTGPKFQTKLPPFLLNNSNLLAFKEERKADLLARLVENQE